MPAGQTPQTVSVVAVQLTRAKSPALHTVQFRHSCIPVTLAKVCPGMHAAHVMLASLTHAVSSARPIPHTSQSWHVASEVAASAVEYVCAEQLVHAADPSSGLYVPAAQLEHAAPSAPVYPALHLQSVAALLLTALDAAAGQWLHTSGYRAKTPVGVLGVIFTHLYIESVRPFVTWVHSCKISYLKLFPSTMPNSMLGCSWLLTENNRCVSAG